MPYDEQSLISIRKLWEANFSRIDEETFLTAWIPALAKHPMVRIIEAIKRLAESWPENSHNPPKLRHLTKELTRLRQEDKQELAGCKMCAESGFMHIGAHWDQEKKVWYVDELDKPLSQYPVPCFCSLGESYQRRDNVSVFLRSQTRQIMERLEAFGIAGFEYVHNRILVARDRNVLIGLYPLPARLYREPGGIMEYQEDRKEDYLPF